MTAIDLRSDTVTRPGAAMRAAMAGAEVGDDVYGEDPTVRALQERVATLLGKEAALYLPSGTMANQIAIAILTEPGDEVVVGAGAHCMVFEGGSASAFSGVQCKVVGEDGLFTRDDVEAAINPPDHHFAPTRLIAVENTHNRSGGRLFPQSSIEAIAALAKQRNLALHLDGARLMNATVASGVSAAALAAPFDTVSLCLSKGLGAPVGSMIAASRSLIERAHRRRKMLGGGMRQAGVLAAAGLYALEHHVARLAEDHEHARAFAAALGKDERLIVPSTVETNIVIWALGPKSACDAATYVKRCKERGVLLHAMGPRTLRAVTHLDVDRTGCLLAAERALLALDG